MFPSNIVETANNDSKVYIELQDINDIYMNFPVDAFGKYWIQIFSSWFD